MWPYLLTVTISIIWILGNSYTERREWKGKKPFGGDTSWGFVRMIWKLLCFGSILIVLFDTFIFAVLFLIYAFLLLRCFYIIVKSFILSILKAIRERILTTELIIFILTLLLGAASYIYISSPEDSALSNAALTIAGIISIVGPSYILFRLILRLSPKPNPYIRIPKIKAEYYHLFMSNLEKLVRIINAIVSILRLIIFYSKAIFINKVLRKPMTKDTNIAYDRLMNNPKSKNIRFTLVEQLDHMTIFHGRSKNAITEKNLRGIEAEYLNTNKGKHTSVSASLENDDPHLFKVVIWQENPNK